VRAQKRLDAALRRVEAAKPAPSKDKVHARVEKLRADVIVKAADADAAATFARMSIARKTADERLAQEARRRAWPVSMMVSAKTQRLYVRQGFEPVLELPVSIRDSDRPLGTHAFYATETISGTRGWLAISLRNEEDQSTVLDRIDLPPQATALLASSAWLGSALIVSDEAPYKETAAGTDFIVVLSDEPQGALKIRTPEPAQKAPLVARSPAPRQQQPIRAYRSTAQDHHFRHPLGFFP
jgi:hypothetical protein